MLTIRLYGPFVMSHAFDRPVEDLNTRARIRDAAMMEFGTKGFKAATMRSIAASAGVSVGLVQHHFGTKDGLRAACDERVLEMLRFKTDALDEGQLHQPQVLSTLMAMAPLVQCYVSRAMVDESPGMATMAGEVMDLGEAFLTKQQPDRFLPGSKRTRDAAAVMTAVNTSIMVMQPMIAGRMGIEPWTTTAVERVGRAMLDVFEAFADFVDSDVWRNLRSAVDAYSEQGESG